VGEHFADGVDVHSSGYELGGVGVAKAVEGDVFFNAAFFEPGLEFGIDDESGQPFEDEAGAGFSA